MIIYTATRGKICGVFFFEKEKYDWNYWEE